MSHRDVKLAEMQERLLQSLKDRLIQQLVLLAAARLLFLSSQERTDLFTAVSVSLR